MAVISGIFALINGLSTLIVTPEERLAELEKKAEDLANKAKEAKANYRTLDNSIKKLDELKKYPAPFRKDASMQKFANYIEKATIEIH